MILFVKFICSDGEELDVTCNKSYQFAAAFHGTSQNDISLHFVCTYSV